MLMTGGKEAVNDLKQPDRIKPVLSRISVAPSFNYTIPPMSVQFITIKTKMRR
jgi:alpha-L-arabinofuranosidase